MISHQQEKQWQQFNAMRKNQRVLHALLLLGKSGSDKKQFAEIAAKTWLCEKKSELACGQCHSCCLFQAGSHPDFKMIEPEESAQMIKIDQIRDLTGFVYETAQQGLGRVIIINPATHMNMYSMNALLKTLEEPAPRVFIILIAEHSLRLPATILSRCQKISFYSTEIVMKEEQMTIRNEFYQELIGLSQDQIDPLQLAIKYQEMDLRFLLDLLFVWTKELLRTQLMTPQDFPFKKLKRNHLLEYSQYIQKTYSHIFAAINLNKQLLLEDLFIRWRQYVLG